MKVTGNGNELLLEIIFFRRRNIDINPLIITMKGKSIPYDETTIDGDVVIEDNVWLGQNVTILQGVKIGEGAIIQAGSVVVSDIPSCSIAGGHPAKVFKMRNEQHYYELKSENKFF